jgi:hypothetical protein
VSCANGRPHSGSRWFHGKDGVAGSIPAGGSLQQLTSGNAALSSAFRTVGRGTQRSVCVWSVGLSVYRIEDASLVSHLWSVGYGSHAGAARDAGCRPASAFRAAARSAVVTRPCRDWPGDRRWEERPLRRTIDSRGPDGLSFPSQRWGPRSLRPGGASKRLRLRGELGRCVDDRRGSTTDTGGPQRSIVVAPSPAQTA